MDNPGVGLWICYAALLDEELPELPELLVPAVDFDVLPDPLLPPPEPLPDPPLLEDELPDEVEPDPVEDSDLLEDSDLAGAALPPGTVSEPADRESVR
ncbi:hypothetical protein [Micromonospora sp. NPDC004704]